VLFSDLSAFGRQILSDRAISISGNIYTTLVRMKSPGDVSRVCQSHIACGTALAQPWGCFRYSNVDGRADHGLGKPLDIVPQPVWDVSSQVHGYCLPYHIPFNDDDWKFLCDGVCRFQSGEVNPMVPAPTPVPVQCSTSCLAAWTVMREREREGGSYYNVCAERPYPGCECSEDGGGPGGGGPGGKGPCRDAAVACTCELLFTPAPSDSSPPV
jgi:hypothetical protein